MNVDSFYPISIPTDQKFTCGICFDRVENSGLVHGSRSQGSGHLHPFHLSCIQTWLKQAETCPYCRKKVRGKQVNGPDEIFVKIMLVALSILLLIGLYVYLQVPSIVERTDPVSYTIEHKRICDSDKNCWYF